MFLISVGRKGATQYFEELGSNGWKICGFLLGAPELPQSQHPEESLASLCSWIVI